MKSYCTIRLLCTQSKLSHIHLHTPAAVTLALLSSADQYTEPGNDNLGFFLWQLAFALVSTLQEGALEKRNLLRSALSTFPPSFSLFSWLLSWWITTMLDVICHLSRLLDSGFLITFILTFCISQLSTKFEERRPRLPLYSTNHGEVKIWKPEQRSSLYNLNVLPALVAQSPALVAQCVKGLLPQ